VYYGKACALPRHKALCATEAKLTDLVRQHLTCACDTVLHPCSDKTLLLELHTDFEVSSFIPVPQLVTYEACRNGGSDFCESGATATDGNGNDISNEVGCNFYA